MKSKIQYYRHKVKITQKVVNKKSDLAYANFTSDSTGKPKGIKICLSNIINLVKNQNYITISSL
jgi:non-ribosomal peptide synthetase component F